MSAPSYGTPVQVRSFTDSNQYASHKWTVQGVKGGSKIDEVTDILNEQEMESTFSAYVNACPKYDQVLVFEYTVVSSATPLS